MIGAAWLAPSLALMVMILVIVRIADARDRRGMTDEQRREQDEAASRLDDPWSYKER